MRFVWAGENAAIALGCAPNKRTETSFKRWSRCAFKRTLERFVCGENAIRPQIDPTAKRTGHFLDKTSCCSQLCCALWDEEVFVDSLQFCSWQVADKLEVVRSLIEIWWLAMRLRCLQCIYTIFPSHICASFSKLYIAWSGIYKWSSKGWPGIESTRAVVSP